MVGTFVKSRGPHAIEIFGDLGYDFVVIDEEHAPFDRRDLDIAVLASHAADIATVVRVADPSASSILNVLDLGASGVLSPHVATIEQARALVSNSRFTGGSRGASNAGRSGRYGGIAMDEFVAASDRCATVFAMIEDPHVVDDLDRILAMDEIDAIFIGRGDLAVALGARGFGDPRLVALVGRITTAARAAGKPIAVATRGVEDAKILRDQGASIFIVHSDQGFLRLAAGQTLSAITALNTETIGKD